MIDKSKYTQTKAKRSLKVVKNEVGDVISSNYTESTVWKRRLVDTKGMNMCKKLSLFPILSRVIKSNLEMKVVSYLLENQSRYSFVKASNGDPITIQQLASKFDTSDRKIRGLIAELEAEELVYRHAKRIYINPLIQLPYGNSEDANYIIQLMWKHRYKFTEAQLAEAYSSDLTIDRTVEV